MEVEITIRDNDKEYHGRLQLETKGKLIRSSKPQIRVKKKLSPQDRIIELVEDNFFKKPKSPKEIKEDLDTRGHNYNVDPQIRVALLRLVRKRIIRRISDGEGKNKVYKYVNI